jgi:hypothetical protein
MRKHSSNATLNGSVQPNLTVEPAVEVTIAVNGNCARLGIKAFQSASEIGVLTIENGACIQR